MPEIVLGFFKVSFVIVVVSEMVLISFSTANDLVLVFLIKQTLDKNVLVKDFPVSKCVHLKNPSFR